MPTAATDDHAMLREMKSHVLRKSFVLHRSLATFAFLRQLYEPIDVTFDVQGALYVADNGGDAMGCITPTA